MWLAACLAVCLALGAGPAGADSAAGERLFGRQCSGCHSAEPGVNRAGPSLYGVVGRPSGSLPGFDYSDAMRGVDIEWTPENLDAFLAGPSEMVPGTKMVLWGLPPEQRRDIIAYLESLGE